MYIYTYIFHNIYMYICWNYAIGLKKKLIIKLERQTNQRSYSNISKEEKLWDICHWTKNKCYVTVMSVSESTKYAGKI